LQIFEIANDLNDWWDVFIEPGCSSIQPNYYISLDEDDFESYEAYNPFFESD